MADDFEYRQGKLEDAISKLTEISADLNKMIAVHELRISQQEKFSDNLELMLERRRDEVDSKIGKIYSTIREEDKAVIDEINNFRKEFNEHQDKLSKKINDMERMIWVYFGGFSVIIFVVANWSDIIKLMVAPK